MSEDLGQISLTTEWVDLTENEKAERAQTLAHLIREVEIMDDAHAGQKKAMKEERTDLQSQITALALTLRTGREERPIQ